jgi:response regulator RpfG family c-di-GMP phosphodiesterase
MVKSSEDGDGRDRAGERRAGTPGGNGDSPDSVSHYDDQGVAALEDLGGVLGLLSVRGEDANVLEARPHRGVEQPPALRSSRMDRAASDAHDPAERLLREDPTTRNIPVIALSAAATERDRQRGLQAGFSQYLTKPVRVDELIAALDALFVSSR